MVENYDSEVPRIEKLRFDAIRRNITVRSVCHITPRMLGVTFEGEELAGFHSSSPMDHIKLFFPTTNGEVVSRDYTPRRFDTGACALDVEFFLHGGGVGSDWAEHARAGDALQIGGPRSSTLIDPPGGRWLLVGDESALPSISRRLEELPETSTVIVIGAVTSAAEERHFNSRASVDVHWVHRSDALAASPEPLVQELANVSLPAQRSFLWIGTEGMVAKRLRDFAMQELGYPAEWIKASSYWTAASSESA